MAKFRRVCKYIGTTVYDCPFCSHEVVSYGVLFSIKNTSNSGTRTMKKTKTKKQKQQKIGSINNVCLITQEPLYHNALYKYI